MCCFSFLFKSILNGKLSDFKGVNWISVVIYHERGKSDNFTFKLMIMKI